MARDTKSRRPSKTTPRPRAGTKRRGAPMAKEQVLNLKDIRMDGGTTSRAGLDEATVEEYAALWQDGAAFPPVTIFHDGTVNWLGDGFHRVESAKRAGAQAIPADVQQGTRRDAVLFSVGANAIHGLRRTNADKRRAVETLLRDDEWGKWSDREIARRCAVSPDTVGRLRKETSLSDSDSEPRTYTTKHGAEATMDTGNIGRPAAADPPGDEPEDVPAAAPPEPSPSSDERGDRPNPWCEAERVDKVGNVITGDMALAFLQRCRLTTLIRTLSGVRTEVERMKGKKDPLVATINLSQFQADVNNARNALKAAAPYALCPYCKGDGCQACHARGWLGKIDYDAAPPGLNPGKGDGK